MHPLMRSSVQQLVTENLLYAGTASTRTTTLGR